MPRGSVVPAKGRKRPRTDAHDEKRGEIIAHCAALFDKVGYHNTSMQMLADEVGLSKPTLYHYFPSKIAILFAIHDTHIRALLDGLEHEKGTDPAVSLRAACISILQQIASHPGYVRAFMDNYGDLTGEMRDQIRAARREYFEAIRDLIVEGIERGMFKSCDSLVATYGFLGMCNWAYKWYPPMALERSAEEIADALCAPFFDGLKVS